MPFSENKALSFLVVLFASLLPDVDSKTSKIGRKGTMKVFFAFVRHRGIVHSIFFMMFIYLILKNFVPVVAPPFLIGYSIHLFLDCFTIRGVRLFWPFKLRVRFIFRSGGVFERALFVVFLILDCFLIGAILVGR